MCSGYYFFYMCIAKCVTENGVNSNKLRDSCLLYTSSGRDFQEIEAVYNRSQEKFLDLGHLEVLILDEQILGEGAREALIGYLKQEEHIGEDVYVFRTDMLGDVFHWKGARESSIGE